ncbi:MAG: E3 binding domain-containing protein, partial [Actinomycetota bacterium]|nr:E3 binding domain-containing protein [Actinomycetota bacterium]
MADITMPQLGETVTEGTITRWFKKVGDQVAEDEPLFEVSTDKVDSEVPAAQAGYLKEILVEEGETVDVGAKLAVIDDTPPSGDGQAAEPQEDKGEDKAQAPPEPEPEAPEEEVDAVVPEPEAEHEAEHEPEPEPEKQPERERPAAAAGEERPAPETTAQTRSRRVLSPVVRRLLAENDLDPEQIEGTGIEGRIT